MVIPSLTRPAVHHSTKQRRTFRGFHVLAEFGCSNTCPAYEHLKPLGSIAFP